jgi:hypothetical protein
MEWEIDLRELDGLRRWYGKQPKLMRIACGRMLTEFAFGTRTRAIGRIGALMTVRNPRFVASRIQVTKANSGRPIAQQAAWVGSVAKERFSGWTEQEKGARPLINRTVSLLGGRGGNITKQARPSIRLKPGVDIVSPHHPDYRLKEGANLYGRFFAMAKRKKENRLLMVKKDRLLYKRKGNKFQAVQKFSRKQPKKQKWLQQARAIYFRQTDLGLLWRNTCNRLIAPPSKM